jgi:hypothetical protein
MNIRDIQNLHAQYAPHPVVIDLAGHVATAKAIPALPSPASSDGSSADGGRRSRALRYAKRLALAIAAAAVAGGAGMGAARLWASLHPVSHVTSAPAVTHTSPSVGASAPVQDTANEPARAQPLTSADFGGGGASNGLATVNAGELLRRLPSEKAAAPHGAPGREATDEAARAMVSPIHVPHAAENATPPVVASTPPAVSASSPRQERGTHEPAPAEQVQSAPRHVRHVVPHRARPANDTEASQPSPAMDRAAVPASAPGKASDVQLF